MAEADELIAAIALDQFGVVTRQQAYEAGLTEQQVRYRLKTSQWQRLGPQAFLVGGTEPTWHSAVLGACLTLDGVASHRSALNLWGLQATDLVEVTVTRADYRRRAGVTVISSTQPDLLGTKLIAGVPVTSIERTFIDMATVCQLDELTEIAAAAISAGLTTQSRLAKTLRAHSRKGRPGLRRARLAISQLAPDQAWS